MTVRSAVGWMLPLLIGLAPPAAFGQVQDVDPYHVVVTGDQVNLRCGDGAVWYSVATLEEGDLLRVDGEGFGWLRVAYPERVPALIARNAAKFRPEAGVVELTQPSQLKAYNRRGSRLGDSWKNLLPRPLPPGTELLHYETITDDQDAPVGYLVEAPDGARGHVSEQFTRRASQSEVEAWRQRRAEERRITQDAAAEQERPSDSAPTRDGQTQTADSQAEQPAARVAEAPSASPDDFSPDEGAAPHDEPAPVETTAEAPDEAEHIGQGKAPARIADTDAPDSDAPDRNEAETDAADTLADAAPGDHESAESAVAEAPQRAPAPRPIPTIEALDEAFTAVLQAPLETAEIEPLITEHRRAMARLAEAEDDPAAASQRQRLAARVELLRIRLELQGDMQRMQEMRERAASGASAMEARVDELRRRRPYTLVGRLTASAIYNGRRLPLMYRLQSVEGESRRSVAYLLPDPSLDLNAKLGSIVGVEGEGRMDSGLGVRIVRPTRVDVLEPITAAADEE